MDHIRSNKDEIKYGSGKEREINSNKGWAKINRQKETKGHRKMKKGMIRMDIKTTK